jgi:hypothetical protein
MRGGAGPTLASDGDHRHRVGGDVHVSSPTWTPVTRVIVAVSFALFVVQLVWFASGGISIITLDWDRGHYMDAVKRFLDVGTPYLPSEVAAPFDYSPLTFLHPPLALWLMTPFAFLPAVAWYVVPTVVVAWCLLLWRPSPLGWAIVGLCLMWPRSAAMIVNGNTDMWAAAFVALGLRFGWPGPLVLIKPSLAPFALAGIRRRSWWLGVGLVVSLSLPFGSLWVDWVRVLLHAPGGLLYSLLAVPGVAVAVAAWVCRTRSTSGAAARSESTS